MKKEVFLERLEALLQDIPEEEKRDAIDYYRDYLEEAGRSCRVNGVAANLQTGGTMTAGLKKSGRLYPEAVGQNRENEKKKQDFRLEPRMTHSGNFGMRKREKMRHSMRIKEAV